MGIVTFVHTSPLTSIQNRELCAGLGVVGHTEKQTHGLCPERAHTLTEQLTTDTTQGSSDVSSQVLSVRVGMKRWPAQNEGAVRLPAEKGPKPWLGRKNLLRQGNTMTDGTVVEVDGACVWEGREGLRRVKSNIINLFSVALVKL